LTKASEVTVVMVHEKDTTNTQRFKEQVESGQRPIIGTLYIPNSTLKLLGDPTTIVVTVRADT